MLMLRLSRRDANWVGGAARRFWSRWGPRLVSPPPMHDKNHDYHHKNEFALGIKTEVERLFTVLICILCLSFLATTQT